MRNLQLFVILVLALLIGYYIWQTIDGNNAAILPAAKKEIQLTDLPISYCPREAKVVTNLSDAAERTGKVVSVKNCRIIPIANFNAAKLFIKLPQALSFTVTLTSYPIIYAPQLGDVNEDGSITSVDEQIVTDNLFSSISGNVADLDLDGSVTAIDLALVRLNQGISATAGSAGDQINWEEIR